MSWLSDWSKRIKLTIDNTNVDNTLTDFPVLIKISNSSGITSTDVTSVFTELGSDSNRKKIAVTISDGETQCYVEIERFDYSNSVAWLWVKVPSIFSGAETVLYFYYDSTQDNNTTYIGDTTETPAQSVWDDNFKLVMHMAQDPSGGTDAIKDSTSNANHGTPGGSMTTADLVGGKIGKAIDFDGNDYIDNTNQISFLSDDSYSVECCAKTSTIAAGEGYITDRTTGTNELIDLYRSGSDISFRIRGDNKAGLSTVTFLSVLSVDTWHYIVGTRDVVTDKINIQVDLTIGTPVTDGTSGTTSPVFRIGNYSTPSDGWDGGIDEIRISSTNRSAAWRKATYYSNWDGLVSFGAEEGTISFIFTNPVPVPLSIVYGITTQLYLTTTISGNDPSYTYDASFYDSSNVQIGTTVLGVNSGSPAASNAYLPTPSGIDYSWYVIATSSGGEDTSSTYTFSNRFLYEGYITEENVPVSRVVRLYYRDTGELIDSTTSSGVDGYYGLGAVTNDEHFIVVFDNEAGEDYNALILDRLLTNGEE